MQIQLERTWRLGEQIGAGGFGRVFEAGSDGLGPCVAKLVPQDPSAKRELLFVDLGDVRNVVPIIDSGSAEDCWVLIMPKADCSLRQRLDARDLSVADGLAVMNDVAIALADLDGRVVHRDIKPENTLWLNGHWCLADFGISRYAGATTAPDTRKFALTPVYASPEQWRAQRAKGATDVYSLGVMAYEVILGKPPFSGSIEDLHESHLHQVPPSIDGVSPNLSGLIAQCLYKAPGARPSAEAILKRLQHEANSERPAVPPGLAKLQQTNLRQVEAQSEKEREASARESSKAQRAELYESARQGFRILSTQLREIIHAHAPVAQLTQSHEGWSIKLASARIEVEPISKTRDNQWNGHEPAFQVIAHTQISVTFPQRGNYEGRSHSLWYCDAKKKGEFEWFETAFMLSPPLPYGTSIDPFALAPGAESGQAVCVGMATHQIAWPFEPFNTETLSAFVDRWASWFGDATNEKMGHPERMPERPIQGSWRTS